MKPIYLDLQAVAEVVSLSESAVKHLVRQKQFPQPREISRRRVAWLVREVEEWAEKRPVSTQLPPGSSQPESPQDVLQAA